MTLHTENGETHSLPEWAAITGLSISAVRHRVKNKLSLTLNRYERECDAEYPCGNCHIRCNFATCSRWRAWFGKEWNGIRKAGEILKSNLSML